MIIGQMHNFHFTGMSTWCLYYLHDCMLQMRVNDDGIICTIAINGIRTMTFLIVIVNPEYHIIFLIVRDSVILLWSVSAEFGSPHFCWVQFQFASLHECDSRYVWLENWQFYNCLLTISVQIFDCCSVLEICIGTWIFNCEPTCL